MRIRSLAHVAAATAFMLPAAGSLAPASPALASSARIPTVRNTTFAGYGNQAGRIPSWNVTTTLVVPKLKCGAGESGIAPGVEFSARSGVTFAGLFVGCYGGRAHSWPVIRVNGAGKNYTADNAHPGDVIAVRASENAAKSTVSIVDQTHRFRLIRHGAGAGSQGLGGFSIGDQSWNSNGLEWAVAPFGILHFSHSFVDGRPLGSVAFIDRWNRVSPGGPLQIETGALSRNHQDFNTIFKRS